MKKITKTKLGVFLIENDLFQDDRGFFMECWRKELYNSEVTPYNFVQDNVSYSRRGVLRGFHYHIGKKPQEKLVQVFSGKTLDVVVNIDPKSRFYGKAESFYLTPGFQVFIPGNFAHAFQVLSPSALVSYKCTEYYNKKNERTIIYNDPKIDIQWPLTPILSDKDMRGHRLKD